MAPSTWRAIGLWFAALAACCAVVAICMVAVDRPTAEWVSTFPASSTLRRLTHIQLKIPIIVLGVAMAAAAFWGARQPSMPRWSSAVLLAGTSALTALVLTSLVLKPLFGRSTPKQWVYRGIYGFDTVLHGHDFNSFPSGHMAVATAFLTVVWLRYPHLRIGCGALATALAIALIGLNWHFVSDVIAGAFVGASMALAVVALSARFAPTAFR